MNILAYEHVELKMQERQNTCHESNMKPVYFVGSDNSAVKSNQKKENYKTTNKSV